MVVNRATGTSWNVDGVSSERESPSSVGSEESQAVERKVVQATLERVVPFDFIITAKVNGTLVSVSSGVFPY